MHSKRLHKYILGILLFLGLATRAIGQNFSYVYIQGDKITPFYVKMEGEMLPRYSKNYYIISQLAPGPIHIQVLFQQNEYPSQNFTIQVPDNGYRGFLLTKKGSDFALYDIQQRFYLLPGDAGEDHLPEMNLATENAVSPTPARQVVKDTPPTPRQRFPAAKKIPEPETPAEPESHEPAFIDNIELANEHVVAETRASVPMHDNGSNRAQNNVPEIRERPAYVEPEAPQNEEPPTEASNNGLQAPISLEQTQQGQEGAPEEETDGPEPAVRDMSLQANAPAIPNSDCPEPMGDARFDDIFTHTEQKDSDEKRISYLMKRIDGNCFTTRQAALLARKLDAESLKYSFLKKVYPRVTDQQNFPLLEQLFRTNEWKSYFRLIQ